MVDDATMIACTLRFLLSKRRRRQKLPPFLWQLF